MKQLVEIYIRLAELETKREVSADFFLLLGLSRICASGYVYVDSLEL